MQTRDYESPSPRVRTFLRIVDELGAIAAAPLKALRGTPEPQPVRKILLLRCDGIGDVVFSTPAIRAMRAAFPAAQIDLVVGPWCKDVAEMIPGVDHVISHAPWGYRKLRAAKENLSPWEDVEFARRIRREGYDLALDLRGDLLSIVPMSLWNIPRRFARVTRGGAFAVTDIVPPAARGRGHEVERTIDVVAELGAVSSEDVPRLAVPAAAIERARGVFAEHGQRLDDAILLLPGAQWEWRRWPTENFAALARALMARGHRVAAVGAKGDLPFLAPLVEAAPGAVLLAGKLDLKGVAGALVVCRGFVASESGPAAIASGVGARGVVLFGPGIPEQFGPRGEHIRIVREPCGDRPCYQRGDCQRLPNWCMARIEVDRVVATLGELLR